MGKEAYDDYRRYLILLEKNQNVPTDLAFGFQRGVLHQNRSVGR